MRRGDGRRCHEANLNINKKKIEALLAARFGLKLAAAWAESIRSPLSYEKVSVPPPPPLLRWEDVDMNP